MKLIETISASRGPHAKVKALANALNGDAGDGWTYKVRQLTETDSVVVCFDEDGVEVGDL